MDATAGGSVWKTYELLEAILLNVDIKTLLISALRVNRAWYQILCDSTRLQQALFFLPVLVTEKPDPGVFRDAEDEEDESKLTKLNPLLQEKFSPSFFDFTDKYNLYRTSDSFYALPWTSMAQKELRYVHQNYEPRHGILEPHPIDSSTLQEEANSRKHFTRKGASWRRMLVTQPPPPSYGYLSVDLTTSPSQVGAFTQLVMIKPGTLTSTKDNLTMGDLYDIVQHRASHHPLNSLYFRFYWIHSRGEHPSRVSKRTPTELLEDTCMVIEMLDLDDKDDNHPPSPPNPAQFDLVFRCEESEMTDFKFEETLVYQGYPYHYPEQTVT